MIKNVFLVVGFLMMVLLGSSQSLTLITYNIRYNNPNDGDNRWETRKNDLADQVKFYEPDILGIQEGLHQQVIFLDSCLTDYGWVGVGRDDGKTKGEYSAIFYNKSTISLFEEAHTFWLSETPDKISVGWDASMERICTYALFQNLQTGELFYVFNTHFDHIGKEAQQNSALLILKKMNEINTGNLSVFLMGDFNMEPNEKGIRFLASEMNDSKIVADKVNFGPNATFNGFNFQEAPTKRIDYIFTSRNVAVEKYAVLTDSKQGRYYSDHFAVFVEILL
ncbi:MAG: endonuclease/exonuclease/phosphatase family protein [Bacteroidales bacterium]|nr:endonuclease/exonuclease/phosphatase family protein [Bacteroidales bacterium]MCF8455329.1 endonuclease/exonuclease/phosphatase family protein [Bacteroidales bacterium]